MKVQITNKISNNVVGVFDLIGSVGMVDSHTRLWVSTQVNQMSLEDWPLLKGMKFASERFISTYVLPLFQKVRKNRSTKINVFGSRFISNSSTYVN